MKPKASPGEPQLPLAERMAYLIAGFLRGTLTEAEHDELDAWIVESDENLRLFEELTDEENLQTAIAGRKRLEKERALPKPMEPVGVTQSRQPLLRSLFPYLIAAALMLVAGLYFFAGRDADPVHSGQALNTQEGAGRSAHHQAVLTLAGGRTIILDAAGSGLLINEGGVQVAKGAGGELVYTGQGAPAQYHTLSIPRGCQYRLVLSDGTRVWLNAESSLRFPAGFASGNRVVELRGEGYFEVAKEQERPFRVKSRTPAGEEQVVEVLGTEFTINGYDAPLKTTLVEGSVRVEGAGRRVVLRPGEQAVAGKELKVVKADLQKEVAWKEGLFVFRDATIQEIAGQITRWYDVEVEYRGSVPYHFNATIEREAPLSRLLTVLEATRRVHFTLDGKKLIIGP